MAEELQAVKTRLVVSHRINPFSPATFLNAFFTATPISPSNQLNVITEPEESRARAVCVVLNSALFFAHFFLLKEESTGRYINVRFYDLEQMPLYPPVNLVPSLCKVFAKFARKSFPALRHQFDQDFDQRYEEFWEEQRGKLPRTARLWSVSDKSVNPSSIRLEFDLAVCKALDVPVHQTDLLNLYATIVKEMIMIRGLTSD